MIFRKGTARIVRSFLTLIIAVSMIITTGAGAVSVNAAQDGKTGGYTYTHVSIAVIAEGASKMTLAEKPLVSYSDDGENWKNVELGREQGSQKNGREYQSGLNYRFTGSTVFKVTARFTDGNKVTDAQQITITDIPDYKGSGKSFYEYCRLNYCDNNTGLDMKLTYEEIIENFYDAVYNVDGDKTLITDSTDYKAGDKVTVTDSVPQKDGFTFEGWKYGDDVYKAGDEVTMPEGGIEFVAVWKENETEKYTVVFNDSDGTLISEIVVEKGQTVTPPDVSREDYKSEGEDVAARWIKYNFDKWIPEGDYTVDDLNEVAGDMVFTASYSENEVKVRFYVLNAGLSEPSELSHYPEYNYSRGIEGTIHFFREIANDDEAVSANIAFAPDGKTGEGDTPLGRMTQVFRDYSTGKNIELGEDQYIKWYVIKEENDGWHVDGIIETKHTEPATTCEWTKPETKPETTCEQTKPETKPETTCEQTKPETKPETTCEWTKPETKPETTCEQTKPETKPETTCEWTKPETKPETTCEWTKPETKPETTCEWTKPETKPETTCEWTKPETEPETTCEWTKPETKPETTCERTKPETEPETTIACTETEKESVTCTGTKETEKEQCVDTGDNGRTYIILCVSAMVISAVAAVLAFRKKSCSE